MSHKPKILVVGDVMLDRYIHGVVERISPEAPIPILRQTHIEDRPGGAANVACNLASLGADVVLVGNVAADEPGAALGCAIGRGIRLEWAQPAPVDARTAVKTRAVGMGQQMLRMDIDGTPMTDRQRADMRDRILITMEHDLDALVLSDYAGGVLDDPQPMIRHARSLGVPVYVDPKGTDWDRYRGASLIKPNEHELAAVILASGCSEQVSVLQFVQQLLSELQIPFMLLTRGADGMSLFDKHGSVLDVPATSGPVVDVTGAGDTVLACMAYLRATDQDASWQSLLRLTAKGAAAVCARHGTSVVVLEDLDLVDELEPA
jgi:rfaE bifunctional protein kinase chain/domain